jgi:CubicO group peptidase (beta-lactamase class C family)
MMNHPDRRLFLGSAAGATPSVWPGWAAAPPPASDAPPVTGRASEALKSIDWMMTAFVTLHDVPGAAMAVTRNGKLVYARGFGYADAEKKEPARPDTLFRIASVSKPVTGAAVLRLVENGKLALTDRAFGLLDFKPHLEKGAKVDPRLKDITVQQLLHHTAGWDRAVTPDPMMQSAPVARALGVEPPAMQRAIIRYVMGKPLDFAPGTRDAYSNFGYCVLGRVIEKASGQDYEEYVREEILAPLGITRMRVGKTLREGRLTGEACYYDPLDRTGPAVLGKRVGQPVPLPYGAWCLEAMDSHGGWVASAIDLMRFAAAFDRPDRCPVLSAKSVSTMFARPAGPAGYDELGAPKPAYYACGWEVRPEGGEGKRNTWHGGALSGSAAWLVRRHDGINWVALFNTTDSPRGDFLGELIDFYGHHAINKVKKWPEFDLFREEKGGRESK